MAMIDRVVGGGLIRELTLGTEVDSVLDILRHADAGNDGLASAPLDPAYARRVLEEAVAASGELIDDRILAVLGRPPVISAQFGNPEVGRTLPNVANAWISWTTIGRGIPTDVAERLEQVAERLEQAVSQAIAHRSSPGSV